jgi:hypothetical protein
MKKKLISRASLKTPEWCKFKEGKKHRPIGHALQPDAEVVPLWSSNLCAKILNEFIDFKANLPSTLSAKKMAKALPSLISCVFKEALSIVVIFFALALPAKAQKKVKPSVKSKAIEKRDLPIQASRPANTLAYEINYKGDTINITDNFNLKQGFWVIKEEGNFDEPTLTKLGKYVNDLKQGRWYTYIGPELVQEETYTNDVLNGEVRYYEAGFLNCVGYYSGINNKGKIDTVNIYNPETKEELVYYIPQYIGSVKDSTWTYYHTGTTKVSMVQIWNDDDLINEKSFDINTNSAELEKQYQSLLPHNQSAPAPVPFANESKGKKVMRYTNFNDDGTKKKRR